MPRRHFWIVLNGFVNFVLFFFIFVIKNFKSVPYYYARRDNTSKAKRKREESKRKEGRKSIISTIVCCFFNPNYYLVSY